MSEKKSSFDYEDLLACGRGELFGPGNAQLPLPPMLMFDRISEISEQGGVPKVIVCRNGDQVRLRFPTREEAAAFAERHGIAYRVHAPAERTLRPKSYADNFRPDRVIGNWTH